MSQLMEDLLTLNPEERRVIYTSKNGVEIAVTHTGKISPKDFAVSMVIPGKKEFNPTHIRLLIDLYIKRLSNPEGFKKIYYTFEEIFNGKDPSLFKDVDDEIEFSMKFDEWEVNLYCTQLLMIEQEINYGPESEKPSKMAVAREYLMRFIRWVATGDNEIDRIIFAAAGRRFPAPEKYSEAVEFDYKINL